MLWSGSRGDERHVQPTLITHVIKVVAPRSSRKFQCTRLALRQVPNFCGVVREGTSIICQQSASVKGLITSATLCRATSFPCRHRLMAP